MNYYNEIKNKIIDNEIYANVKDYSKEQHIVITYFEIGRLLTEAGKHYGENIIVNYGKRLSKEIGNKYNYRTLYRMRKLYNVFSNEKLTPLVSKLSWSHYLQVLSLKDENEIMYYINQAYERKLGKRELGEIVRSKEYERLPSITKEKLKIKENIKLPDLIPNTILIKNSLNYEKNIRENITKTNT